jgi:hypothetical protein
MAEEHSPFWFEVVPRQKGGWTYWIFRDEERLWPNENPPTFWSKGAATSAAKSLIEQLVAEMKGD